MTFLYTDIGERVESAKRPSEVSCYRDGNRVPGSVYYQYRNIPECSLFHRYIIQVFKDIVAEGCGVYDFIAEGCRGNKCT